MKQVIARAIEIVVFVFGAFGGFLEGVAPPGVPTTRFAVGISCFLALAVLLFVSAIARKRATRKSQRLWLVTAAVLFVIAAGAAFTYHDLYTDRVIRYPPGDEEGMLVITGDEMVDDARKKQEELKTTDSDLLAKYGGLKNINNVWTEESIRRVRQKLVVLYTVLVVSLLSVIFSLVEGTLARSRV